MAKEKILVVDDEADILELVRYNLSREGYHVTGTLSGEDALRKVRSDPFDLIVLDLMLPGRDGLDICREIRAFSRVPVIMTTARVEEIDRLTRQVVGHEDAVRHGAVCLWIVTSPALILARLADTRSR